MSQNFIGLARCVLCTVALEGVTHLMLNCPFVVSIWIAMLNTIKIFFDWNTTFVDACIWDLIWATMTTYLFLSILCWPFGGVEMLAFFKIFHWT